MGSYRSYSFLVKLQPLVPQFAAKVLPLGRTAVLVPEFAVKDLALVRTLIYIYIYACPELLGINIIFYKLEQMLNNIR